MIPLGDVACEVFLACGVTDLRRGFQGLYALIAHELHADPLAGQIFVFCNRKRDAVKLLFYHAGGLWVCAKRLEQGTFRWPERGERTVRMTTTELHALLQGMDVVVKRVRDSWWRRPERSPAPSPVVSPMDAPLGTSHVAIPIGIVAGGRGASSVGGIDGRA